MIKVLNLISIYILPLLILFILTFAIYKKTPAYESFVDGAKDGFNIAIKIIPYLIAIMVCTSLLRASGMIEILQNFLKPFFELIKVPIDTLLIMITRSLSGSATLGVLADIINQTGVESYATKLSAVIAGSSETTFYVASVYFGSVGIKKFKHALLAGILADFIGIVAAVFVCSWFFP